MTIQEAQAAARRNLPVIYDDPLEGVRLYARIGSIRKDYALLSEVARGKPAETYSVEVLPMNGARTVSVVPVERVRAATAEELWDVELYRGEARKPEVHPELLCPEVKTFQSQAEGKE